MDGLQDGFIVRNRRRIHAYSVIGAGMSVKQDAGCGIIYLDRPMTLDPQVERRLQTEQNLWLATVRPDGTPHLVPIWFVWVTGKIYLCTGADSVKVRNLLQNPHVTIALEDGNQPIVIEGLAQPIGTVPKPVIAAFQKKFDWNISTDGEYNQVIEIEPQRIRA